MADRLLRVVGHQVLEFCSGLFVFEMCRPGSREDRREFGPGVRRGHVDNAHCLDARLWWLHAEQHRGFTGLDATPEFAFRSDDEMLVKRIGVRFDFHPLAAAGDHRKYRSPGRHDPHIVLQLRGVLRCGSLLRELPGQHKFGLEHIAAFDTTVEGCRHPMEGGVAAPHLDVGDGPPRIGLIPAPIQFLGGTAQLHN